MALRSFLRRIRTNTRESLTASVDVFSAEEASRWWREELITQVRPVLEIAWRTGHLSTRSGPLDDPVLAAMDEWFRVVTDRLSRTDRPTIPRSAFDVARQALSEEVARGSSVQQISERVAAEFGWSPQTDYWRRQRQQVADRIDSILDPLGPPGSPAREAMKAQSEEIRRLQDQHADLTRRIERDSTRWQVRATRIARTETAAAHSAGAQVALQTEGAGVKIWVATRDDRVRASHLAAHGQCVPLDATFSVGGTALMFPADPAGPPGETIQCRCTHIGADSCDDNIRDLSLFPVS